MLVVLLKHWAHVREGDLSVIDCNLIISSGRTFFNVSSAQVLFS